MRKLSAAAADEEAELRALSDQADQSRQALAATAEALSRAIAVSTRPSMLARRALAGAVSQVRQVAAPARRVTVIAVPAVVVLTAAAIYLLRRYPR